MKLSKKLTSILCAAALLVSALPAAAATTEEIPIDDKSAIIMALQDVEENKDIFELGEVEFTDLYVGNSIQAYEYVETGLKELYFAYPLFFNGDMVALAIKLKDGHYQISSALVNEIKSSNASTISLIYDAHAVYLFDGKSLTLMAENSMVIPQRKYLNNALPNTSEANLNLCDLEEAEKLNYVPAKNAREQTYFSCNVKYVPQGDKKLLCWAATIACINNYVNKTNLTAVSVAQNIYGTEDYDHSVAAAESAAIMRREYGLDYTYGGWPPSDSAMLNNIQSGYPMYGSFATTSQTLHAATIYGINPISGYITVMDPKFGSATAYYGLGSTYYYFSPNEGVDLFLVQGVCHTWQE